MRFVISRDSYFSKKSSLDGYVVFNLNDTMISIEYISYPVLVPMPTVLLLTYTYSI